MGKIWGGYHDLSNASSIRLTYRVEAASSLPGHAALGVVLLDGKACGLAPHCSQGIGFALTDYLSSGNLVFDEVGGWRTLEIDLCGEANPYAPFFGFQALAARHDVGVEAVRVCASRRPRDFR